jgi:hypothetical protein
MSGLVFSLLSPPSVAFNVKEALPRYTRDTFWASKIKPLSKVYIYWAYMPATVYRSLAIMGSKTEVD